MARATSCGLRRYTLTQPDFGSTWWGSADGCAGGRVVSLLEGGYDLQALGNSVAAHVATLMHA